MQVGIYVCMSVCLSCCLSVWRVDTMGGVGGQRTGPYTYIYIYTYMHIHISICLCSLMVQACLHPSWHSTSQRAAPKASCWEAHQPSKQMTWGSVKLISAVGQCKPQNLTVVPNSRVLACIAHSWATPKCVEQDLPVQPRMAPNSLTPAWQVAVCPPESRARSWVFISKLKVLKTDRDLQGHLKFLTYVLGRPNPHFEAWTLQR